MNPETLQALEESIAHWQRLSTHQHKKGEEPGAEACALCHKFRKVNGQWSLTTWCKGCPVKEYTGKTLCAGTPYTFAAIEFNQLRHTQSDKFLKAARKELLFLVSLLPDGHPTKKIYDKR